MPYLVDGNNLIGHSPDLRLRSEASRRELVKRISAFHRAKRAKVIVIFDGEAGELVPDGLVLGGVKVIFSGRQMDADRKIKQMLRESTTPKNFIVVSSDNEIYNFARSQGAKAMKCHQFNQLLREAGPPATDEAKPRVNELEEWYRYFGLTAPDDEDKKQ